MEISCLFLAATPILILNLACLFMCPNWDLFATHEIVLKGVVVMENNVPCRAVDIG